MMKKAAYIKCVVAAVFCLAATSCNKTSSTAEQQYVDNFNALVMGGKTIDPYQDWSTVGSVSVTVKVDLGNTDDYTVYILQTPPIFDSQALWLGMAKVKGGESKTINVAKPANAGLLYAACYDSEGHAICKPVPMGAETQVTFSGKSPSTPSAYSTTGNPWNVERQEMPDVSEYTTGDLVEVTEQDMEISDDPLHFKVSSDYTGFVASLGTYLNKSVYVTATWTLSFNQRVSGGNVIVVGDGGTINIPKGFTLTTSPFSSEGAGYIYVLPGGTITGEGTVEFTTDEGTFSYNGGTITAKTIQLKGCTLYNAGTVGDAGSLTSELTCVEDASGIAGQLVNVGTTALAKITGNDLSLENAGYLKVNGELVLSNVSKMDDGSYTECQALTLNGSSQGNKLLYMGNAAYLNCLGDISIDNYGVWGPSGDNFKANAILKVNNCTLCNTTDGEADTYLLNHVELIVPENFPTVFDKGAMNIYDGDVKGIGIGTLIESFSGYNNLRMLYYWMNGYEGKPLSSSNYAWSIDTGKYNYLWKSGVTTCANGVDAGSQTCFYSNSPSYNYNSDASFKKTASGTTPSNSYIFYAIETLEENTKDFDYNDVVLRVNMPVDNGDGTFTSNVQITCVGNTVTTYVLYNGSTFGEETHAAMGIDVSTMINTNSVTRSFRKMGEITFNNASFQLDKLDFSLSTEDKTGNQILEEQPSNLGKAPLFITISGDTRGKWFWPTEGMNIGVAYPQFSPWAADLRTHVDWYDSSNASNNVVTY